MQTDLKGIPYLDQYFGVWAMHESHFWNSYRHATKMNLHLHMDSEAVAEAKSASGESGFQRVGNVAMIGIHGTLMKQQSSMSRSTSTVMARRQIRAAARDPDVSAIMLHIDSPGGTAAGTAELGDDVAAAAKSKPVHAFIEDMGASAAYWVASQASHIATNRSGMVGSIGTYGVVYDYSQAAAMEGIKAHVIRAGDFKGAGVPGTEVTPDQLAEIQRNIDAINQHFLAAVKSGRGFTAAQVNELADGRVHVGNEAKSTGLVDSVESFDRAFSRLERQAKSQRSTRMAMSDVTEPKGEATVATSAIDVVHAEASTPTTATATQPQAASYDELKQGCIGADAAFICSQLEAKATIQQAQASWMQEQQKRLEAAQEDAKTARTEKPGVAPVKSSEGKTVEATGSDGFWAAVKEKQDTGMSRPKAISAVTKQHPDLHAAMLAEANTGRKRSS